uniref:NFAT activation molecule 1 isoform X1 n=1 Tax=Castor canadensis TaxID=51338 RepID=A0A8B7UZE3_CASCN|nr:NFAT activation molecule 1 isoform X1 [Castor canadensis]
MESWLPWCWAQAGPLSPPSRLRASQLLCLLLVPWTLQLAGGQSVIHTGLPIVVSLANTAISFSCRITYQYTPQFKDFTVTYFHVDLHGQKSSEEKTNCRPSQGTENQTFILDCQIMPRLPDSSATGTYYCCVHWPGSMVQGNGTFILVRDMGYQQPPPSSQKALLFGFTGLLTALSILITALLLWKKVQVEHTVTWPHHSHHGPGEASRVQGLPLPRGHPGLWGGHITPRTGIPWGSLTRA